MSDFDFGAEFKSSALRTSEFLRQRDINATKIIPTGISYVDDCALGLHPTDLMILSASTGAGKTTAGLKMAANAAASGRRAFYFALEAFEHEIEGRLLFEQVSKLAFEEGIWKPWITFAGWMNGRTPEVKHLDAKAKELVDEHYKPLHTLYRAGDFTREEIQKQFKAVANEASIIVLDHVHFVDMEESNENLGMKNIIKAIRDASLGLNVPVVCVAHLRKATGPRSGRGLPEIGDIHGSSDISKIATKIVMLSPCPAIPYGEGPEQRRVAMTAIQVLKDRYAGATNYVGLVGYDLATMQYKPKYSIARLQGNGNVLTHLDNTEIPYFARKYTTGLKSLMGEETKLS